MRESMIKAKFKGKLPSLGYWPRKKYLLRVYRDGHWRGTEMFCWIERMDGKGKCPYATRESFRKNWEHMGGLFPTGESENEVEGDNTTAGAEFLLAQMDCNPGMDSSEIFTE